jgi:hypothetical protein
MQKSPDAFRTISEVAADLDIPQHVLRFWETRFPPIRPLKRGGGRRYYRPDDVDLLKGILKQDGLRFVQAIGRGEQGVPMAPPDSDADDAPDLGGSQAAELQGNGATELSPDAGERMAGGGGAPPSPTLADDDVARLRSALDELLECERILGTLRHE